MNEFLKRMAALVLVLCMLPGVMFFASAEVLYKEGDKGNEVMKIKDRMLELGYYNAKASHNQYNATMTERVKQLQKVNGLEQTGVIDQELYDLIFSGAVLKKNGKPFDPDALKTADEVPADETQEAAPQSSDKVLYKEGDKGKEVMKIKERMVELGYYTTKPAHNQFNETMTERIKELQKINGLEETGVVTESLYALIFSDEVLNKKGKPLGALAKGDSGKRVQELKERMRELLYFDPDGGVNSLFNDVMEERVMLLQETNGFEPTGYVTTSLYDFIMSDACLKCGDWYDPYYQVEARHNYALSGEKLYSLSESGNVVVFIIDYFANNYMDSLLRSYPKALSGLEDFTYYSNCDPRYIGTYPSITHMLTGAEFEPGLMVAQWFQKAWSSDSAKYLYNSIHELGYEFRYYYYSAISNGMKDEALGMVDNLIDLRTYTGEPIPGIQSYGDFNEQLLSRGLTVDQTDSKYIQMIHLRGAHSPYTVDANGFTKENASREENIAGYLQMIKNYIAEMKRLGLYDDATIIITADHGDKSKNMQVVYFIKEAGETHEKMDENTAPISHDDFPGTLLAVIGGDYSQYGTSIFDWNEGDTRERSCGVVSRDINMYPLGSSYSDKGLAAHNVWRTYTYTGDGDDLMKVYSRNKYKYEHLKQAFN